MLTRSLECHVNRRQAVRAGEDMDVRAMSLSQLAVQCGEETEKYRAGRPDSSEWCFELCRRAMADGDQQAWTHVYTQYHSLVLAWTKRHPSRASVSYDDD